MGRELGFCRGEGRGLPEGLDLLDVVFGDGWGGGGAGGRRRPWQWLLIVLFLEEPGTMARRKVLPGPSAFLSSHRELAVRAVFFQAVLLPPGVSRTEEGSSQGRFVQV